MEEIIGGLDISFKLGPTIITIAMLASFIIVGMLQKVTSTDGYWAAGRSIGPVENGAAVAANWMSAASYLGVAGTFSVLGFFAFAYIIGWSTGYFILLVFMASQIRKYGKYTAPDFIGDRYYSDGARAIAAVTSVFVAITYAIAQYSGIGLMFGYVAGMHYDLAVIVGTVAVIVYILISGMLGATRNMVVQYVILIIAFCAPLFILAYEFGFPLWFIPHLGYGPGVQTVMHEVSMDFVAPFAQRGAYHFYALMVTCILGTNGLPHVLIRFYTVRDEKISRWSAVWGVFFILLLYLGTPAYSTIAIQQYFGITGQFPLAGEWADATVVLASQFSDMVPGILVGLSAAGGMAAAFATTAGLFMAGSAGISNDIYTRIFKPEATQSEQVLVARIATVAMGIIVTFFAFDPPAMIADIVGMAFAIAANVIFPVFFMGIWWEKTTKQAAIASMVFGLLFTSTTYAFMSHPWFIAWLPATSSSLWGVPIAFIILIVVSKMTPKPPERIIQMIRYVNSPVPRDAVSIAASMEENLSQETNPQPETDTDSSKNRPDDEPGTSPGLVPNPTQ